MEWSYGVTEHNAYRALGSNGCRTRKHRHHQGLTMILIDMDVQAFTPSVVPVGRPCDRRLS